MDEADFEDLLRVQNRMAQMVAREAETDIKIKLLTIIDEMITPKRKKIQVELLLIEAESQGMSEGEILATIDKLKDDDILIEPEQGYIQKT
jgi:DNA replicative helicase MCM subunit Mcm2 (Cdc46/Mcm family)